MRVLFRQSGGFAGTSRGCELDSSTLPPADSAELERLMRGARLEARPAERPRSPVPDLRVYEIVVTDDARELRASFTDSDLEEPLAALVRFLQSRSAPRRPE
jgi:hypothetical protein